jgi:hypothetical protein
VEHSNLNELQLKRSRRSDIFTNDQSACYKPFFVGNAPPTGFSLAGGSYKYICQQIPGDTTTYFATMFDQNVKAGIPIYSAYVVTSAQALNFATRIRDELTTEQLKWRTETGNVHNRLSWTL